MPRTFATPRIQLFAPGTRVTTDGKPEHFARLFARDQKILGLNAKRNADPLALARRIPALAGQCGARELLELL